MIGWKGYAVTGVIAIAVLVTGYFYTDSVKSERQRLNEKIGQLEKEKKALEDKELALTSEKEGLQNEIKFWQGVSKSLEDVMQMHSKEKVEIVTKVDKALTRLPPKTTQPIDRSQQDARSLERMLAIHSLYCELEPAKCDRSYPSK